MPPPTAEAGQALSTQTRRCSQTRFGAPSSARSSTQALTVLSGPVTNAEWAVGTAADSAVSSGQGCSAVAKPWATAQLRMSVTTSAPFAST